MKTTKRTKPKKNATLARHRGPGGAVAQVTGEIRDLIETTRSHVSTTANLALVNLYWNIGRVITQDIQRNEKRAKYGTELMDQLAAVLTRDYGRGYSVTNLWDMKRFFICFEILQPMSGESTRGEIQQTVSAESSERILIDFHKHQRLGWSHYRLLLSQTDPLCRTFYFEQAADQRWIVRERRRQIERGLFERVALSKDTPRLAAREKRTAPTEIVRYEDIFKDPYVLDFLGLKGAYSEKDLEAAIVHNLEQFLTELGTDFCFIGRENENEPVGLILCTSARRQHVELLLQDGPHKMKVAEYLTHLPDKRLLKERLKVYSKLLQEHKR